MYNINFTRSNKIERAGAIIINNEQTKIVLVLNRLSFLKKENKFGLPKGHLNPNELKIPEIGAQREVLEETGVFFPIDNFKHFIKICDTLYYILTLDSNFVQNFSPHDKHEICYTSWFDLNSIKYLNINRTLLKSLKQIDKIKFLASNL
ncbi:putative nucleoside diphosphate hydrolase [Aureococcus anophagefferens virus]|uniref:Putative nucleoside diphosphate hydrolase n=1 Tax=Aureococcus anophagefferens virus TaxID=1474867 RepID=A0A076FI60_9VIRU|nr:putative nucleoside diphosphate hydrolase [Aureococcus anophagefferens virus]AII17136.1 putative nucleoside diphosphate hydrolase [Aureococcus anophagefferens virus]UOG94088.1 hypothetical protein MKD35_47 [Aureococcus anophagefferens virus]